MFCKECGYQISDTLTVCPECGVPTRMAPEPRVIGAKNQSVYVVLGFFFGQIGAHNFYAGYTKRAVVQVSCSTLIGSLILYELYLSIVAGDKELPFIWSLLPNYAMWIWGVVEICTVKKDAKGVKFS